MSREQHRSAEKAADTSDTADRRQRAGKWLARVGGAALVAGVVLVAVGEGVPDFSLG